MKIERETEFGAQVLDLLNQHLQSMAAESPPESMHALDVSGLQLPEVTFWCAWEGSSGSGSFARSVSIPPNRQLMGCGAIKELGGGHGEIKSMKTSDQFLRQGVAAALLEHMIHAARDKGLQRLSLETGSMEAFQPAHRLYSRYGFEECRPFGEYVLDPHSLFMTLSL